MPFAIPPPSLLPARLAEARLNSVTALTAASKTPIPAEGMSVLRSAEAEAASSPKKRLHKVDKVDTDAMQVDIDIGAANTTASSSPETGLHHQEDHKEDIKKDKDGMHVDTSVEQENGQENGHQEDVKEVDNEIVEIELASASTPFDSMTVRELRAYASKLHVSLSGASTKDQIRQKLKDAASAGGATSS